MFAEKNSGSTNTPTMFAKQMFAQLRTGFRRVLLRLDPRIALCRVVSNASIVEVGSKQTYVFNFSGHISTSTPKFNA